jgi:peptide/nickel transport system substrate-binding protein
LQNDDIKDKEKCTNTKIQVNVRVTNFPDTSNFQALLIGQEIPPDPDQYQLWHSEQSTNFTKYKNTRIDALLEKGRKTAQKNERKAIYQEFQQFLLEDAPAIFTRHLESFDIKRK